MPGFEQENDIAKVERFLTEASARYRAEDIPLGNDGRLDPGLKGKLEEFKAVVGSFNQELAKKRRKIERAIGGSA